MTKAQKLSDKLITELSEEEEQRILTKAKNIIIWIDERIDQRISWSKIRLLQAAKLKRLKSKFLKQLDKNPDKAFSDWKDGMSDLRKDIKDRDYK